MKRGSLFVHSRAVFCTTLLLAAFIQLTGAVHSAHASSTCVFLTNKAKTTWTLTNKCTTDETIVLPNGISLLGGGFTITAIDPAGGSFQGPVLLALPGTRNVTITNLRVDSNLQGFCNADQQKLIGILFDGSPGIVADSFLSINKGAASVCEEGIAIKIQNQGTTMRKLTVKNSLFKANQLAAVQALGKVNARIENNEINGVGPTPNVAQRGIEIADGAKAYILNNRIFDHNHNPLNADPAYGILLTGAAASTRVEKNIIKYNDIGIRVNGGKSIAIVTNTVWSSTLDGILVDDELGIPTTSVSVMTNDASKSLKNGIHYVSYNGQLTKNLVKSNLTTRNREIGILMEGLADKIQKNTSSENIVLDIADAGVGNKYSLNVCTTSSGPPVDCPQVVNP